MPRLGSRVRIPSPAPDIPGSFFQDLSSVKARSRKRPLCFFEVSGLSPARVQASISCVATWVSAPNRGKLPAALVRSPNSPRSINSIGRHIFRRFVKSDSVKSTRAHIVIPIGVMDSGCAMRRLQALHAASMTRLSNQLSRRYRWIALERARGRQDWYRGSKSSHAPSRVSA